MNIRTKYRIWFISREDAYQSNKIWMDTNPTAFCAKIKLWTEGTLHPKFDGTRYLLYFWWLGQHREINRKHVWPMKQTQTARTMAISQHERFAALYKMRFTPRKVESLSGWKKICAWELPSSVYFFILRNNLQLLTVFQKGPIRRLLTNIGMSWRDSW